MIDEYLWCAARYVRPEKRGAKTLALALRSMWRFSVADP